MKVAVFGLGYVGTVTAACLAANGHEVTGVDPESTKVTMVADGRSPVVEPGLEELIRDAVATGALSATDDPWDAIVGADVSLVCVGTPSSPSGSTDLSYVLRAVKEIGQAIGSRPGLRDPNAVTDPHPFHCVVIRSTVPPGTIEETVIPALESAVGRPLGEGFGVAVCPEFLREGSGVSDFLDPPFTVVGTAQREVAEVLERMLGFLDRPFHAVPLRTAEGLKFACNAFHAVKVSFANELARLYRPLGVDARQVMDLFCEDDRLNIAPTYLRPGFAFGGSCLPKDLRSLLYLGRMSSVETPLLAGTMATNQIAVRDVVERAVAGGGRDVALLGLSFKSQTDDLRESPNVELAEILVGKGFDVRIFDPVIQPSRLVGANRNYIESHLPHLKRLLVHTPGEALAGATAAIVSSHAPSVVDALVADPPPMILDLTGRLGGQVEALAGYQGAGW